MAAVVPGGNIWVPPVTPQSNAVFEFAKQASGTLNEVKTMVEYDSQNSNVQLSVFFLEYYDPGTVPYYQFTEDTVARTKSILLDETQYSLPTPFEDLAIKRKVIPNYTATTAPAVNDPRWIESLTETFTIRLYDCEYDFTTPSTNLDLLQQPADAFSIDKFRY